MTSWPVKTLDDLCHEGVVVLGRGNIISKKDIAANPGPYPIYSSARENGGKFGEYGDFMFDEEMITWSIDGGGRLFYRPRHKFSVTNVGGTLRILKPEVLETRYLHRALENLQSRKVFDWVFKAHPSVIRKVYDEIPVPPLEEQRRVAALLDDATARITELTACYEQARTHANDLFTSALRDALEGNPDWPVKTLGEVCEVLDSLRKPITKRDRIAGDYPYYGATGIVDYVADYIFNERLVLVGEDGAKWGAGEKTAFIAEGKYWVNNHAHVLRCKPDVIVDSWLANFLNVADLNTYVSGLTVPKLNQGSLVSIEISVPPLEEQERIVARLDQLRAKTSEMVAAYDAKLQAAKNLRQSILEAAFAGEL